MTVHTHANRAFYAVVFAVALTGAGQSAAGWLHWVQPFPFLAVGSVELGGVALSVHADRRRQLGERAIPARILSAAVAVGAVAVNYFGHRHAAGAGVFFAGMSALGYTVWLIDSASRRRDALRAAGKLTDTTPVYGPWSWLRHPGLTRRARTLALANPDLGPAASQAAAREQVRAERRTAAIAASLRQRIAEHVDPRMAVIAVNTYDLDQIAARLAGCADYDGLAGILSAELVPARLAPVDSVQPASEPDTGASGDIGHATTAALLSRPRPTWTRHTPPVESRRLRDIRRPHVSVIVSQPEPTKRDTDSDTVSQKKPPAKRQTTADRVAAAVAKTPNVDKVTLAKRLNVSVRTVERHLPAATTTKPINGAQF